MCYALKILKVYYWSSVNLARTIDKQRHSSRIRLAGKRTERAESKMEDKTLANHGPKLRPCLYTEAGGHALAVLSRREDAT